MSVCVYSLALWDGCVRLLLLFIKIVEKKMFEDDIYIVNYIMIYE